MPVVLVLLMTLPLWAAVNAFSSTSSTTTNRHQRQQRHNNHKPATAWPSWSSSSPYSSVRLRMSEQPGNVVEAAAALSEYMAKAHEEKLRALKEVETRKAIEIQALKDQIDELKRQGFGSSGAAALLASSTPSSSPPQLAVSASGQQDLSSLTKDQLVDKLLQYQQFMQNYIVKAQEQKVLAVAAAEGAVRKKFEDRLALLGSGSAAPPPPAAAQGSSSLYGSRSSAVAAAAAAGKSRWGDMEVQRAAASAYTSNVASTTSAPPPEVEAADHGLRADGGVGGPSLAERVALGSNIGAAIAAASAQQQQQSPSSASALATPSSPVYQQRNNRVLAAAAAGKTRWGPKEVERIKGGSGTATAAANNVFDVNGAAAVEVAAPSQRIVTVVPPEVEAADHGLRADGGVGGPSLAERVALGAGLGASTTPVAASPVVVSPPGGRVAVAAPVGSHPLYQQRNAHVLASAAAGKSRWGSMEVQRLQHQGGSSSSSTSLPSSTTLSSNQRVNLGARLLGNT